MNLPNGNAELEINLRVEQVEMGTIAEALLTTAQKPSFEEFVDRIFNSDAVDTRARNSIKRELKMGAGKIHNFGLENAEKLIIAAIIQGFSVVTRFVPPYSSTVTFFKNTTGFITLSRLDMDFDEDQTDIVTNGRHFQVTKGALAVINSVWDEIKGHLQMRHKLRAVYKDIIPPTAENKKRPVFICNETNWTNQKHKYHVSRRHDTVRAERQGTCAAIISWWDQSRRQVALTLQWILSDSHISFEQGPAAVLNDFLYGSHDGSYCKKVSVIDGELSAQLNFFGIILASLSLGYVNLIVTAIVAFGLAQWSQSRTWKLAAFIVALSLQVYQFLWNFFVATTTLEAIASNDFRVRRPRQATMLFGVTQAELKQFMAMTCHLRPLKAHGHQNSYLDVEEGILSIKNREPLDILYVAGYLTTSMTDPDRVALAAYVPYDTHRRVYSSNDTVRILAMIDGHYHLSRSSRSCIVWKDEDLQNPKNYIIVQFDRDRMEAPAEVTIIGEGEIC